MVLQWTVELISKAVESSNNQAVSKRAYLLQSLASMYDLVTSSNGISLCWTASDNCPIQQLANGVT